MSNYKCKIRIKETGEIKDVTALDNFYGNRQYGYNDGKLIYREEDIEIIDEDNYEDNNQ